MRHLTLLAVLPFTFVAAPAQAQMVTITPTQIGQIFCIGSLGNDMAPVEAVLSPDLSVFVANAWARNAGFVEQAPDEKPPLGDGLPWRTWQDYADGCLVGVAEEKGDDAFVIIGYSFSEYPRANYENTLVLTRVLPDTGGSEPVWRIDDIDLGDGLSMRSAISGAFAAY